MNQNTVEQAYRDTYIFNDIAGNVNSEITGESIAAQLDYIQEEYLETVQAFDDKNTVEFLDGICDILVTAFGLAQKMSAAGYNVDEALKRVCQNNLSKYPKIGSALCYDPSFEVSINTKYNVCVLKDPEGKIRKFKDFKSVDLSDLAPKEFFKENV
jgi:hypothetical protein